MAIVIAIENVSAIDVPLFRCALERRLAGRTEIGVLTITNIAAISCDNDNTTATTPQPLSLSLSLSPSTNTQSYQPAISKHVDSIFRYTYSCDLYVYIIYISICTAVFSRMCTLCMLASLSTYNSHSTQMM